MSQLSPVKVKAARRPVRPKPEVETSSGGGSTGPNWKLAGAAALSAAGLLSSPAAAQSANTAQVKVMSLNVWVDCRQGMERIAEVIRAGNPDVVGLQEIGNCAQPLSEKLGYQLVRQNDWKSMLTRLPVESVTPARHGMVVRLSNGQPLAVFNAHLHHTPYQPYQLLGIPYGDGAFIKSETEAQEQSRLARGADVQSVLDDMATVDVPKVLTGDFNEPSHLDWTQRAAESGRHPIKVEWPTSKAFADAGLKDSYRVVFPDEMAYPGDTWTPFTRADDPTDHHDRLDFVMYGGPGLEALDVKIIGPDSDIVVTPYPTDHRGVMAELTVTPSE